MASLNYFVCTLGQAALLEGDQKKNYENINHFLDTQAVEAADLPAVGFYDTGVAAAADGSKENVANDWTCRVLTFRQVHQISLRVAAIIPSETPLPKARQTVALLCPSTPEFLFVWLALMRLGHAVLLIAPQCSASAVAHLCATCEVQYLLHDVDCEKLAKEAVEDNEERKLQPTCLQSLLPTPQSIFDLVDEKIEAPQPDIADWPQVDEGDVAYLHHTSGTSSGTPKPIPQTHRAGLGVLPHLDGRDSATFTTTPLYHGGIADLLRAWSSDALIWLFPGKGVPFTPTSIVRCLDLAKQLDQDRGVAAIKYFSAVPYILQIVTSVSSGVMALQRMDIVGVGGAALPASIGDMLVQYDINLVSRFGSAECGFLMSSHRQYEKDKDWQYLRLDERVKTINLEPRGEGLSELVVLSGWPHMAKKNRDDGSFVTADLLKPHPTIQNAWIYHSRADSQLTLITGKKFDPAPLEATIATNSLLRDVLIFGDNQPFPGALLFRSEDARHMSDRELLSVLKKSIDECNAGSQKHVRLPRSMLTPMSADEPPLEKSSKGTVLRKKAEERYRHVIEAAYEEAETLGDFVDDEDVPKTIKRIIIDVVGDGKGLCASTDLFTHGIDSVACVQIRRALLLLLPKHGTTLPMTVVEDCGSIQTLSDLILSKRHGTPMLKDDEISNMHRLLESRSSGPDSGPAVGDHRAWSPDEELQSYVDENRTSTGQVVLITGATGALGAHVLDLYINCPETKHIYLLVRGATEQTAVERVSKALSHHKLTPLPFPELNKITILRWDSSRPDLGINPSDYKRIAATVTVVHHIAWTVNFRLNLSSFSSNLDSLRNLIELVLCPKKCDPDKPPPKFIFCSSLASVANYCRPSRSSSTSDGDSRHVPEAVSWNPRDSSPLGYSRSKWVAERICEIAHETSSLRNNIAVMRVGQLSGNTETGIWNSTEAYPLMLSQVTSLTRSLPDLGDMPLHWLPIDIAAASFKQVADAMLATPSNDTIITPADNDEAAGTPVPPMRVYHILNTNTSPRWVNLLSFVKTAVTDLQIVPPPEFVHKLEDIQANGSEEKQAHPAMKLVPHWKASYCPDDNGGENGDLREEDAGKVTFATTKTCEIAPVLGDVPVLDDEYFELIWKRIQGL